MKVGVLSKSEYKDFPVEYSTGRGSIRVRKGRTGSPEFWSRVEDAEALRLRYCGSCHLALDAGDMFGKYQCADCYRERLTDFTNYRPPKVRQSYQSMCPREDWTPTGTYRDEPDAHRRAWDQYRAEDAARAAREVQRAEALRLLAEFKAEHSSENADPVRTTTGVKLDTYSMYDPDTRARLIALRQRLSGNSE